jgi:glutathione S-transferase
MRLYLSSGSPFVRKVRVMIREKGLLPRVEEIAVDFPYKSDAYTAVNPVGQVPALVADDGTVFVDSPVICAWLDSIGEGPRLLPPEGPDHWRIRRQETIADHACEMAVKLVLESRRPENERSPGWIRDWRAGLYRALDRAEAEAPEPGTFDLGAMSLAIAATYVEFRGQAVDWRDGRPRLAALRDSLEERQSFKDTFPV